MRRNLTISFDDKFIESMDEARGRMSRGVWIEALTDEQGVAQAISLTKDLKAAMSTSRSEKPGVPETGLSHEPPADILVTEEVKERYDRQRASQRLPPIRKPPLQRPIVQKRS